jgi:hypothetical protein
MLQRFTSAGDPNYLIFKTRLEEALEDISEKGTRRFF